MNVGIMVMEMEVITNLIPIEIEDRGCDYYGRSYYNAFIDGCTSITDNTEEL